MYLARAIHFAATVLAAGTFAFLLLILRGSDGAKLGAVLHTEVMRWLRLLNGWSLLVAALSWIVWLALIAAEMSGRPVAAALTPEVAGAVIARTTFGHVWMLRAVLLALLASELFFSRHRARTDARSARLLGAGCAAAFLVTLAWCGHAVGTAPPARSIHLASDAAHLLAVGLWLGALVPLLLVLQAARAKRAADWSTLAARATQRFSSLGVFAIATLFVTGLINAWFLLGSVPALIETPYGRLLSTKVALFAMIVAIAAFNRTRLLPRLLALAEEGAGSRAALQSLRRNAIAEVGLGALVLVIAGALGTTAPPLHMRHSMDHHAVIDSRQ